MAKNKFSQMVDSVFNSPLVRILSVIVLIFGLFSGYKLIFPDKPNFACEIVSDIDVVTVNENISRVKVLVDNNDIIKDSLSLKIYEIRVCNNGNDVLLKDLYASNELGFKINNGHIIEKPTILNTSNEYISDEIHKHNFLKDSVTVKFPKVALDGGDYYSIRLLILFHNNEKVTFDTFGKISTVKDFNIEDYNSYVKSRVSTAIDRASQEPYIAENERGSKYWFIIISLISAALSIGLITYISMLRTARKGVILADDLIKDLDFYAKGDRKKKTNRYNGEETK